MFATIDPTMKTAEQLIPAVTFTADTAVMRRGDLAKLESLRIDWEYSRRSTRTTPDYQYGDITNHAETLRRIINMEWQRITNPGQWCRIYNIDHAHDVIRVILAWATERIAAAEYTFDDYLAAFPDDRKAAERAYRSSVFS